MGSGASAEPGTGRTLCHLLPPRNFYLKKIKAHFCPQILQKPKRGSLMPCSAQPWVHRGPLSEGPCPAGAGGWFRGWPMGSALPSWKVAFETARHFLKGFSGESPRSAVPAAGTAAPPAASIKRRARARRGTGTSHHGQLAGRPLVLGCRPRECAGLRRCGGLWGARLWGGKWGLMGCPGAGLQGGMSSPSAQPTSKPPEGFREIKS